MIQKYDTMVDSFRENMEENHPNLHGSLVKKAKVQVVEEVIFQELDLLNVRLFVLFTLQIMKIGNVHDINLQISILNSQLKYQLLVDNLYHKLQQLSVIALQEDPSFEVIKIYDAHINRFLILMNI